MTILSLPQVSPIMFNSMDIDQPHYGEFWDDESSLVVVEPSQQLKSMSGRQSRTLAPNLTRRSHKKSRAGCYTCKSRKIKCGEEKPSCGNCQLKVLECIYPTVQSQRRSPMPLVRRSPQASTPGTAFFTMADMRFFHHFLTIAYPHLPLGNDQVWIHEIPQFAEEHKYLMHAILSLGASHLSRVTGSDYRKESLIHRGHAIAGLNQALSKTGLLYGEADAMIGACYALTFQASHMGDGLADFITMVRGCALTTGKVQHESSQTAFNLHPDQHFDFMANRLENLPRVDPILLIEGCQALEEVKPFVVSEADQCFYQSILEVLEELQTSSKYGYVKFTEIYAVWYGMSHECFKMFLDPSNMVSQLLQSYFVALQLLMIPIAVQEWSHRLRTAKIRLLYGIVEWAQNIFDHLEYSGFSDHLDWPKRITSIAVAEIEGSYLMGPTVLQIPTQYALAAMYGSSSISRSSLSEEIHSDSHSPGETFNYPT